MEIAQLNIHICKSFYYFFNNLLYMIVLFYVDSIYVRVGQSLLIYLNVAVLNDTRQPSHALRLSNPRLPCVQHL